MLEVISKIYAKEDKIEELISVFSQMVAPSQKEEGYIQYEMYQDEKEPATLLVVEQWESMANFEAHCNSELFHKVIPNMVACMAKDSEVNICHKVA